MAQNGTLSSKQIAAIDCLLRSPSVTEAATCAKVPRRTIYNWLANEDFKRELETAQRALVATAARRLASGLDKAVTSVLDLAERSEDEAVRLRAAVAVADMYRDLTEHYEMGERITMLESMARGMNEER